MLSENAVSPSVSKGNQAKRLYLASSNSSVARASTLGTTTLRLVPRDPSGHSSAHGQPSETDEQSMQSRSSFIRMSIAAALAPGLWLLHTYAQQIQHAF